MRDHHALVTSIPEVGLVSAACWCGWAVIDNPTPGETTAACRIARCLADLHTDLAAHALEAGDA